MQIFRLAWRNLLRNRIRTAISATAISLSFFIMLLNFSLKDASYQQMLQVAVKVAGGHLLVHADGWQDSHATNLLIIHPEQVVALAQKHHEIQAVIPRIIVAGLLGSSHGAELVRLVGIDRQAESKLSDMAQFLDQGTFLEASENQPLVLGPKLARKLTVKLGDRVVLTTTDHHGELVRELFHVSGIFQPKSGLEEGVAFTTLSAARKMIGAESAITEMGMILTNDNKRSEIASTLKVALRDSQLEVRTWEQVLPELQGTIQSDKSLTYLLVLVIFIVVGFGIANTLLTSVLERVRELGLLSALGLTPKRTAQLVLAESTLLALGSLAVSYVVMLALHFTLTQKGIKLAAFSEMKMEWGGVVLDDLRLRTAIEPARWFIGGVGVALIVVLSGLYPAWKAARLDAAQAMRTYE